MPDLTPNIGLYWYYFLEIFDHFREFFLCVFNLSVLACATPLIIRLRCETLVCVDACIANCKALRRRAIRVPSFCRWRAVVERNGAVFSLLFLPPP